MMCYYFTIWCTLINSLILFGICSFLKIWNSYSWIFLFIMWNKYFQIYRHRVTFTVYNDCLKLNAHLENEYLKNLTTYWFSIVPNAIIKLIQNGKGYNTCSNFYNLWPSIMFTFLKMTFFPIRSVWKCELRIFIILKDSPILWFIVVLLSGIN